jgi:monoamine oxidase
MAATESDVIIIGGGVAGLAAAAELARKNFRVVLLEARERLGGRIFTTRPKGWGRAIELGAEFIHEGNPPLWRIVRQHRLRTRGMQRRHWLYEDGKLVRMDDLAERIERVTSRIDEKRVGTRSFADFLQKERGKISEEDATVAAGFIEGFEAAPMREMSARAVAGTTLDDEKQFQLPGGYDGVVNALADSARRAGVNLRLNAIVRAIEWRRGAVTVRTGRKAFTAKAAIVTLPLGVLQRRGARRGAVRFEPVLREKQKVLATMGVGHVIRLVVRFDARKWRRIGSTRLPVKKTGGFGFIHSRIPGVPVWWSLYDDAIVTGWAGGPAALALEGCSRRGIFEQALGSLAHLLGTSKTALRAAVIDWQTHNWSQDPFSGGAYSFTAAGHDDAAARLREPVQHTLFFAGEAMAEGEETGTVHGALSSGLRAAHEVRKTLR